MRTHKVAILGASGYTGCEAIRLISSHPHLQITALTAHSHAGQAIADIFPQFSNLELPSLVEWDNVNWRDIDVAFSCLPHGASQDIIAYIYKEAKTIIDLSADFRLKDPALYARTYNRTHDHTNLLEQSVYGLTEYARSELKNARLVACPGCYPTCSLLSLLPAIEADLIDTDNIIIDAKSGVSGAGRKTISGLIYSEISDGAHAYSVGTHRHAPEIDQIIDRFKPASTTSAPVIFTPHLIPMNRGMITTSYLTLKPGHTVDDIRAIYQRKYASDIFVHVEPEGIIPQTRHVRGSNMCRIAICESQRAGQIIIISVIDNLTKGSAGQALQNYNVIQGWDETLGLKNPPLFP